MAGVVADDVEEHFFQRLAAVLGDQLGRRPSVDDPPALQIYALEIDHGTFERVLDLAVDIDPSRVTAEHRNGLLWIKLPLAKAG